MAAFFIAEKTNYVLWLHREICALPVVRAMTISLSD